MLYYRGEHRRASARGRLVTYVTYVALVALVATTTGCSVIGLGVGAAAGASTDRYRMIQLDTTPPSRGKRIQALVSRGHYESWVEGNYVGVRNGLLIVWKAEGDACDREGQEPGECVIPLDSLLELREHDGSHWKRGMWIGAGIGAVIDLAVYLAVSQHQQIVL